MPITYTNGKGFTYYLCRSVTKTGKFRYYFARNIKGGTGGRDSGRIPQ